MDDMNLVRVDVDKIVAQNGIKIEKSKRKKQKRIIKPIIAIIILGVIAFLVYKSLPYIRSIDFSNLFEKENSDTPPDENKENTENNGGNDSNDQEQEPDSNEGGENDDEEWNDNENTDDDNIASLPDGHYAITNSTQDFLLVNQSECTIDFNKDFNLISAQDRYKIYGKDAPLVLITHFSSRESYSDGKSYTPQGVFYNDTENISTIGSEICKQLNQKGINTIHLNETYASGAIFASRSEYEASVRKALAIYPSICYVINLTREVEVNDDLTMTKHTFKHDEKDCCQISLTVGTSYSTLSDNQLDNCQFAYMLAEHLNKNYTSLVNQTTLSRFSLSQNIEPLCVEVSIGTYANSYQESLEGATLFAEGLSTLLN